MKKRTDICVRCSADVIRTSRRKRKYCEICLPIVKQEIRVLAARSPQHIAALVRIGHANKGNILSTRDENHYNWKGDSVGVDALHSWVIRRLGTPQQCEHCLTTRGRFEWANKSQLYLRDLSDWLRLCRSCHLKYDNKLGVRNGNQKATV